MGVGQAVSPEADTQLWAGASANGWHVVPAPASAADGGFGCEASWAYVGPSGALYVSAEEAEAAREVEAKAHNENATLSAAPELLVGWRVSVYWSEDGEGDWYLGQVMAFSRHSGKHSILYDDQSHEEARSGSE